MPRKPSIKNAIPVGVQLPSKLVDAIDREAGKTSGGTRSSVIRSMLMDQIQQITGEVEKTDAEKDVSE